MCLLEITDLLYLIRIVGMEPLIIILTPEGIPTPDISLSHCQPDILRNLITLKNISKSVHVSRGPKVIFCYFI